MILNILKINCTVISKILFNFDFLLISFLQSIKESEENKMKDTDIIKEFEMLEAVRK